MLHRCDVSSCVNPAHLWLGTNADNIADKMAKGRHRTAVGEAQTNSILTAAAVREIRVLLARGFRRKDVAAMFGVAPPTIGNVSGGLTWKHVK